MSDILCITNRALCREDFLTRIEKIAKVKPAGIILREKDLSEEQYTLLAHKVTDICGKYEVPCILHSYVSAAEKLNCSAVHLPLPILRTLSDGDKHAFTHIGTSCHSMEDAAEAEALGCTYIIAGHIFDTDCKKGLPGRGLSFLRGICESTPLPVYGIGGIDPGNIADIRETKAAGACIMSGAMTCVDVQEYFSSFKTV